MLSKEIILYNKYGYINKLSHIKDNLYKLIFDDSLHYKRLGGDFDNNIIEFIDPEGGPYIQIGYTINDMKVKEIIKDGKRFYLRLE